MPYLFRAAVSPSGSKQAGMPPPAVILPAPVPAEGGDAPSRRHSRHPSRPRRRRDDWGVGNPVALASSTYRHFTSPRHALLVPGNPVAIASSTYRHFTSPRHALLVPGNPEDIALICFALLGSA